MKTDNTNHDSHANTKSIPDYDKAMEILKDDVAKHGFDLLRYILVNSDVSTASFGRLLAPGEKSKEMAVYGKVPKNYKKCWTLFGAVSKQIFDAMVKAGSVKVSAERVVRHPSGAMYFPFF